MKITFDFSNLKEHMNELYVFFKKYKKIFMVFILIGILLSSAMNTFILDKKYQATTVVLINESVEANEIGENINLAWIETYKDILYSDAVINNVVDETKTDYDASELRESIKIETEGNSLLLSILLLGHSPQKAETLSQSLISHFSDEITKLESVSSLEVMNSTKVDKNAFLPNNILNLFLGALFGSLVALVYVVIAFYKKVKGRKK